MLREKLLALLPSAARLWLQDFRRARRLERLMTISERAGASARPHSAPGKLYITLTSIPTRFNILHLTLQSLLGQSVRADGVLLWIAADAIDSLPRAVLTLQARGLIIRACADVRSYTKIVHALREFPDAFLVTADDDNYYEPEWLATLIGGIEPGSTTIVCQRAHRVRSLPDGRLAPYAEWDWDVQDEASRTPSMDLLATGVGGALYPPKALAPEATDSDMFMAICSTADDLWFYWMACRAGSPRKKVGRRFPLIQMPGSQESKLFAYNGPKGNDAQIRRLEDSLGPPLSRDRPPVGGGR